jgi:hypothetical protein
MAGNYDSMVFGPGNGDTVSAEKSARACDSSQGCWVMTGWCPPANPPPALSARECSQADGRALESMKLHEPSWIKAERKSQQESTPDQGWICSVFFFCTFACSLPDKKECLGSTSSRTRLQKTRAPCPSTAELASQICALGQREMFRVYA